MFNPRTATTFLFVPGDRLERFDRAASSGAEVVIIDLEDGVSPATRPAARRNVVSWLRSGKSGVVRLNARGTRDHALDVDALRGVATHVMLSKTESAADADSAAADIGTGVEVMALIETARGVADATSIASSDAVVRLAFGNVDLSAELGVDADDQQALLTARSLLSLASATAGLYGPVDGVTTNLDDPKRVAADASHAASLGFRGKLCIHPHQLSGARSGLAPSSAQVSWAEKILAVASEGEARAVDGVMVDRPVEERARDILRRATPQA
jgi:citrate lyase subunit beta / citryl-CoA lyase